MGSHYPPSKLTICMGHLDPSNIWFLWPTSVNTLNVTIGSAASAQLVVITDKTMLLCLWQYASAAMQPNNNINANVYGAVIIAHGSLILIISDSVPFCHEPPLLSLLN